MGTSESFMHHPANDRLVPFGDHHVNFLNVRLLESGS